MERSQFTFYRSFWEAVKLLPPKDRNAVLNAICSYALDGEEPQLAGVQASIFTLIRPTLDTSARRAESGLAGGSKREANAKQTDSKAEANTKQTAREKEGEKEREGEKEKESDSYARDARAPAPRFTKPTLEEVAAYCAERGNLVDPQKWYAHYESNGWRVGKVPMKDWRAAVRTWERSDIEPPKQAPKQGKPKSFAQMWREETQNDAG